VRGRTFSQVDTDRTQAVAVINEELARVWLAGLEPVGARLLIDDNDGPPRPVEIVGIVGNVRQATLDGDRTWDLYLAYPQVHDDNVAAAAANMFWIVRTTGDPMSLATRLAQDVRRVDADVAASQIRPMDDYLADAIAPRRFNLSLMTAFGYAALALAITGIYAVVVYSTSQRAREIAIRIALGARRSNIVRLVMGQGLRPAAAGLVAGTAMAAGLMPLGSAMLFGVSAMDATAFLQVACVVAAASVVACLIPAVRAAAGWSRGLSSVRE
jgi:putative ABC transport system permease protein